MANSLKCKIIFNLLLCSFIHFHNRPHGRKVLTGSQLLQILTPETQLVLTCSVAHLSQACVSHKAVCYVLEVQNEKSRQRSDWIEICLSLQKGEDEERTMAEKEGAEVGLLFHDAEQTKIKRCQHIILDTEIFF